jgi:general secretion pathway protein D
VKPVQKMTMRRLLVALACAVTLASCATDRLHQEGLHAIEVGQYEDGLAKLAEAAKQSPGNPTYRLDLKSKHEEAVQVLVASADRSRNKGALQDAEATYQRVLQIEPGNARALRGMQLVNRDRRHAETMKQAQREFDQGRLEEAESHLRSVLAEDPGSAAATALRARIDLARGPQSVTPRLRSQDNRPVTLQFRDASTKMVFEVLARQTGINFIFDKDVKNDGKTTIFVQQVPVEQAIDLVLGQNQLARQVLSPNMVVIYPNTPGKQKEYQDQVVRTFYVTNSDPKKVMDLLKTMLNAKTLFVEERSSAVVMRDTPELIRMAERLIASVDVPEAEVMLEVEVLELTRSKQEQLGIRYPQSLTISPTALAGDPLVLADLGNQDSTTLKISDPSVTLDFTRTLGSANILASPRIRARNHEKAKILIGQRVPVITTSTVLTNGANGTSSNVQYLDVGLTVEVEPTVYSDGDVAIKINLEVSNLISTVKVGDSQAYQIGTRNATTLLRLKDGETQVLAGLISDQDRRGSQGIPGLGDLPVLGRLFGTHKVDAEKSEIVLSITPRIIRSQLRPSSDNSEFWYGTDSTLRSAPMASGAAVASAVRVGTQGGNQAAAATAGAAGPAADAADSPPAGAEESAAVPLRPVLSWEGPGQVAVGQTFDVTLRLASQVELSNVRSMVRYDAAVFELQSADAGGIVPAAAAGESATATNLRSGRAQFDVTSGAVTGDGSLLVLHFKALSPRPASMVAVQQFAANGPDGAAVPTMAPRPLTIAVQPP